MLCGYPRVGASFAALALVCTVWVTANVSAAPDSHPTMADENTEIGVSDVIAARDEEAEAEAAAAAAARDTSSLSLEQRAAFEHAYFDVAGDPGVTREQICEWVAEQYMIDVDGDTQEGGLKRCVESVTCGLCAFLAFVFADGLLWPLCAASWTVRSRALRTAVRSTRPTSWSLLARL